MMSLSYVSMNMLKEIILIMRVVLIDMTKFHQDEHLNFCDLWSNCFQNKQCHLRIVNFCSMGASSYQMIMNSITKSIQIFTKMIEKMILV